MDAARNQGIHMIKGEVLSSDKQRMLTLMPGRGFSIRSSADDTDIRIVKCRL